MSYKPIDKEFYEMKGILGEKKYDTLNIITGTLLHQAIHFMDRVGILEEFLEDKNSVSQLLIKQMLKLKKGD